MIRPKYEFILYKYTTENLEFEKGYMISTTGTLVSAEDKKYSTVYWREPKNNTGNIKVTLPISLRAQSVRLIELKYSGTSVEVLRITPLVSNFTRIIDYVTLLKNTEIYHIEYYGINNDISLNIDPTEEPLFYEGSSVEPHYKTLSKKYSKENGQQFFRQSFEGKISLFGDDYEKIKNEKLNTRFALYAYKDNNLYLASIFSKLDCKFDASRKSVELKLATEDDYSLILNKYENTYDLIKLAPAISRISYTKRPAIQLYIQGGNTVSTYFNGLYEEQEVVEIVEKEEDLADKYHFGKVKSLQEINMTNIAQAQLKGLYIPDDKGTWLNIDGQRKFTLRKIYSAGQVIGDSSVTAYHLSTDATDSSAINIEDVSGGEAPAFRYYAAVDLYRIVSEGFSGYSYVSERLYTTTKGYTLKSGETGYKLIDTGGLPSIELASFVTSYNIWARLIGNSDDLLYNLSGDDFALPRANYKKCIGLVGNALENMIFQNAQSSQKPTKYGITDYGTYFTNDFFTAPSSNPYVTVLPLGRSSWVNTSLWVRSDIVERLVTKEGESYETKYAESIVLKDCFSLANVIKALLQQIDPSLKHEATEEYSRFLYSAGSNILTGFTNYSYFIAPKTNVLKGEYDQAAQKAEITFKSLSEMLRDCFRCYWFIDEEKRFRIEHIYYFMNGLGYSRGYAQVNLQNLKNKFNKKSYAFFQNELEFDKSELAARYEFNWMDGSSDAMGNIAVDIKDSYIQDDKTESITASAFSVDLDLMLLFPGNFNNDGFALIAADRNTRQVPIITTYLWDETRQAAYSVKAQNYPVSWHRLINNYLYDMPGESISYNTIPPATWRLPVEIIGSVKSLKNCMLQDIKIPVFSDLTPYSLVSTEIGVGVADEVIVNFDTRIASIKLVYPPE